MRPVGGFISVLRRALRSIGVLLLVFAYLILTFAVMFLYMQNSVCVDDACSNITATEPDNILIATTLTYFMTVSVRVILALPADDWMYLGYSFSFVLYLSKVWIDWTHHPFYFAIWLSQAGLY